LKKEGKTGTTKGEWVKRFVSVAELAAFATVAGLLYKAIKGHQKAMNGCWSINNQSGSKCKVPLLTCDKGDRTSGSPICGSWGASAPNTGKNILGDCTTPAKSCQVHDNCCDALPSTETGTIICQKYGLDKTGKIIKDGNVPLCCQCVPQCTGGTCSSLCDCSQLANCPAGTRLKCVNVDFWGAAGDFLGDALGGLLGGFFKALWRVAKWIILAVGIVVLALVAWKIIEFIISETRKKKSGFGRRRPPRLKYR